MNSNIDLRDVALEAQAELDEAVRECMEELLQPALEQAIRMRWATLSPEQKEAIKQNYPDVYESMAGMIGG